MWHKMVAPEDYSVNFVRPVSSGGFIEARYVRRDGDYFIAYLSSHTGCKHACRFCHLTATGQTFFEPVDIDGYFSQADRVLQHYAEQVDSQGTANVVNFNWMARGEALSNRFFVDRAQELTQGLSDRAASFGLMPKFNVSTIFPTDYNPAQLLDNFSGLPITFYYSLYSLKPEFRRRWLPRALRPDVVLDVLADWQNVTGREVVLHWAFIEGENDSKRDIDDIVSAIDSRGLKVRMNIVRYNPFSAGQGREASEERINEIYGQISRRLSLPGSRIVPRVGFSVKASCGMFVQAVG